MLFYGFVVARMLHFWAYVMAKPHEVRALFFSVGSLLTVTMGVHVLVVAVG